MPRPVEGVFRHRHAGPAALRFRKRPGIGAPTSVSPQPTMTANDSTTADAESVTGSDNWEELGRVLLRGRLETTAGGVREAFNGASAQVRKGDDLEDLDLNEMDAAVQQARVVVDELRKVREGED